MPKGERIKQIRESLGISQTQFAEAIGTTKQNVYKYENNIISNIPSDKVEAMAKILHTTPAYLMGWEESMVFTKADTGDKRLDGIIATYHELNEEGKDDLAKHAEHLTYIPQYQKCDTLLEENTKIG